MTIDATPLNRARSPRDWIAAALRDDVGYAQLDRLDVVELVATAEAEDVLSLLEWKLRNGDGWLVLPASFRNELSQGARALAMRSLLHEHELRRISAVLAKGGIQTLLLKGQAFSQWLYPQPYLRVGSDIDLLFASRSEADRANQALSVLGYELVFEPSSMTYEMTSRVTVNGVDRMELDLHCRLVNMPVFADKFHFEELWRTALPLPGLEGLKGLGPANALAHACIHRTVDLCLHRPDRLKWLYDIHLMLLRMDGLAWTPFIAMSREKGICGVCLRSIEDTVAILATPVPDEAITQLRGHADDESLDRNRLQEWRYMQWQNLKALPTLHARARWLWERLVPTRSHLQHEHGSDAGLRVLLWRRIRRGIVRVLGQS